MPGAHIADSCPFRTDCIRLSIGPGLTMVSKLVQLCSRLTQCTHVRLEQIDRSDWSCTRQSTAFMCILYNFRPTDLQSAQKLHVGVFRPEPTELDWRIGYGIRSSWDKNSGGTHISYCKSTTSNAESVGNGRESAMCAFSITVERSDYTKF